MDDVIVAVIFLVISIAGWIWKKINEGTEQQQEPAKPVLEDIFVDVSDFDMGVDDELADRNAQVGEPAAQAPIPEPRKPELRKSRPAVSEPQPTLNRETPRKPERTVAGIPINPRGMRQGIIISEVLGKPKSLR